MRWGTSLLMLACFVLAASASPRLQPKYGNLPVSFEADHGQAAPQRTA